MNKIKIIPKNQKPIEIDAHFRYMCPLSSCGFFHWLSLKEVQTKNFKVVCDCGTIFKPKQILKLKAIYKKSNPDKKKHKEDIGVIPTSIEDDCVSTLVNYGFTKSESVYLIRKAWNRNKTDNSANLIRYILQNIGDLNELA